MLYFSPLTTGIFEFVHTVLILYNVLLHNLLFLELFLVFIILASVERLVQFHLFRGVADKGFSIFMRCRFIVLLMTCSLSNLSRWTLSLEVFHLHWFPIQVLFVLHFIEVSHLLLQCQFGLPLLRDVLGCVLYCLPWIIPIFALIQLQSFHLNLVNLVFLRLNLVQFLLEQV